MDTEIKLSSLVTLLEERYNVGTFCRHRRTGTYREMIQETDSKQQYAWVDSICQHYMCETTDGPKINEDGKFLTLFPYSLKC